MRAGAVGAVISGLPSTAYALIDRQDVLEGAMAAGTLLLPHEHRRGRLLAAATLAHLGLSLGWAAVLAYALPRGREWRAAVPAAAAIAGLDLGVVGRRFPRIRALQLLPQLADHVAFTTAVAVVIARRRRARADVVRTVANQAPPSPVPQAAQRAEC